MKKIAIIGALVLVALGAEFVLPAMFNAKMRVARKNQRLRYKAGKELSALGMAVFHYEQDCTSCPTSADGLNALLVNPGTPGWKGPYAKESQFTDPWGNRYGYVVRTNLHPRVVSAGPDEEFNTQDDFGTY